MGRREAPVPDGPLHDFAMGLRELRLRAPGSPTYRELRRNAHYSPSVLSAAAAGQRLPTWDVTQAFVTACGGDVEQWRDRWTELHARLRTAQPELVPGGDAAQVGAEAPPEPEERRPAGDDGPDAVLPLTRSDPARIGPFQLLGRLGGGAMGQVYLGVSKTGRPVAVKVVRPHLAEDPHFRRRFTAEVAAVRRVDSPYTPAIVDADTEAERPWMATAYIPGPSLAEVVRTGGPLPPSAVFRLAAGVAEALADIHAAGVLHRDLKPANVLLEVTGPKVIDFGVAQADDGTRVPQTGVQVGTVPFMAPEQADGRPVTAAADVFALGAMLAYAATGVLPFGDGTTGEVLYRIIHTDPDPAALACGDDTLRALIANCLRKDPGRRPTPAEIIDVCAGYGLRMDWLPAPARAWAKRCGDDLSTLLTRTATRRATARFRVGASAALVVAAAAVLAFTIPSGHEGRARVRTTAAPPTATAYALVYRDRRLVLPDYNYYVDLEAGTVVEGHGSWTMSTNSGNDGHGAFELPDDTDAYVALGSSLSASECAAGVARAPVPTEQWKNEVVHIVHFGKVPPGRLFCLRSRRNGEIAVIKVIDTDDGDYGAKIAVDYYERGR